MSEILFQYEKVNPTSWAYLSSFLTLALFFRFNRVISVRNLDLLLLISLAPGLLLVQYGSENARASAGASIIEMLGYRWLFVAGLFLMGRLLLDSTMRRRPLLPSNMNAAGLTFMGAALLFFLMTNVWNGKPSTEEVNLATANREVTEENTNSATAKHDRFDTRGPGYSLIFKLPRIVTQAAIGGQARHTETFEEQMQQEQQVAVWTVRIAAIFSNILIVTGILTIGVRHFENWLAGVAAATTYLLLPYTALHTGNMEHCGPGSLLVWAILLYRFPVLSGMLVGLAAGLSYYPIFLLPLWCSFYWERGVKRFATGALTMIAVLVVPLALTANSWIDFVYQLRLMFGIRAPAVEVEILGGVWRDGGWNSYMRLPLLAAYIALAFSFVMWPAQKNLGTLISGTAALMVGAQFWHVDEGGVYIAWYLPLLLLTIHRPNLENRVATTFVTDGWWRQRRRRLAANEQ